jgi:hypothetical protein
MKIKSISLPFKTCARVFNFRVYDRKDKCLLIQTAGPQDRRIKKKYNDSGRIPVPQGTLIIQVLEVRSKINTKAQDFSRDT